MVATLLGSLLWLALRTPDYQAGARLLLNPVSQDDEALVGLPLLRDAGDPTRTAQTAAALTESPGAAAEAAKRLKGEWTSDAVLDAVSVEPAGQSNILALTATADRPALAAKVANTYVAASLEARNVQLQTALQAEIARLAAEQKAAGAAAPPELNDRLARLKQLTVQGDPSITLAELATPPAAASGAPWWLVILLALFGGALLGAGAAVLAELRSPRRLTSEAELVSIVPAPVLAQLPNAWHRFRGQGGAINPSEIAFRSLHVQLGLLDGRRRSVMVSSPGGGDGKTNLVASLALRLAAEGQDVIVMDLDLHSPRMAHLLGVEPAPGLAAALEPNCSLASALVPVSGIPELRVLPGLHDARLSALHALRVRLPTLLTEARLLGSHVLLDTPPLGTVSDAVLLLDSVDELLVVARVGHTRVSDVEAMRDTLWRAGRTPAGFVVIGGGARAGYPSPGLGPIPEPVEPEPQAEPAEVATIAPEQRLLESGDFRPGDRVAWSRGSARGLGTVTHRITTPMGKNGGEGDVSDDDPRYLVKTERSGKEVACRASSMSKIMDFP